MGGEREMTNSTISSTNDCHQHAGRLPNHLAVYTVRADTHRALKVDEDRRKEDRYQHSRCTRSAAIP